MAKTLILAMLLTGLSAMASAQQGLTVHYRQQQGSDSTNVDYRAILLVNDSSSYFVPVDNILKEPGPLGKRFHAHSSYLNLTKNLLLMQSHPMGLGKLLIEDTLQQYHWRVLEDTGTILDYTCRKAIGEMNHQELIAWYTTELPYPFGPSTIYGLPGLILSVEFSNSGRQIIAEKIGQGAPVFEAPSAGKRVKYSDYLNAIRKIKRD